MLAGVALCFLLSGFAALLYQTAWLRQFSFVFGTSELAVSAVLAGYMGGLAAGAAAAARLLPRVSRPILVYGLLEAGIAASALAVPALLNGASLVYAFMLGDLPEPPHAATIGQPVFYLLVALAVLAIPTGLMGATLPLLTRHAVRRDRDVGPRVALLYATNTAGAVLGTLTAAFVLLPALGLRATVLVGAAVNALVFVIAVRLSRTTRVAGEEPAGPPPSAARPTESAPALGFFAGCFEPALARGVPRTGRFRRAFRQAPAWMLPLMLVSGANAFLYEVLWTRMLSHVLGGSVYAFATMLAAFLSGIAIGGGLGGRAARDRGHAAAAFAGTQAAIAVCSVLVYLSVDALVPNTRGNAQLALYAALVMLPATVFIGATFPLAVRAVAADERQAAPAAALVYAWNTAGAVAGALAAGLVLIPRLGFEGSIKLAVLVNLGVALWTVTCVLPRRALPMAAAWAAFALTAVLLDPPRPRTLIASTGFAVPSAAESKEMYFAVGRSSTVLLLERDGTMEVRTNGLPEASIVVKGGAPVGQAQHLLLGLPLAARPEAERLMVIGLGGGVALERVPESVRSIDVIELEPEVVAANRRASARRLVDPLEDPRINLVINDARNALALTSKRYDVIVSQPSHPWTAGASHLFTREFVGLGKARLEREGVLVQWMSGAFVDDALLRSLAATLLDAFRYVRLYRAGEAELLFLASDAPLDIELEVDRTGKPLSDDELYYGNMGLNGVEDLVAALALDQQAAMRFAASSEPITDDRNAMATHSRARADGLRPSELAELLAPHDPLLDPRSWVYEQLGDRLDFAYMARRLLAGSSVERARALAGAVPDASERALITALLLGYQGGRDGVREALLAALRADPANADARFALLEPELPAFAREAASDEARRLAARLPASATAVVRGWRLAAAGDWQGLAALDAELAQARSTDLWFPEATQLRAEWRIRLRDEPRDALRMIDRALFLDPKLDLYVLRAAAADALRDADAFVETVRYAARHAADVLAAGREAGREISLAELELMQRRLDALRRGARAFDLTEDGARDVQRRIDDVLELVAERILDR